MNWFEHNWIAIVGLLSAPFAYIFGGRQKQNVELRKSGADAIRSMQEVYDGFLNDYKLHMDVVRSELKEVKEQHHEMQKQFNEMSIAYAKEVEVSQNWERLYHELMKKYVQLEKELEKVRKDLDAYKRSQKN